MTIFNRLAALQLGVQGEPAMSAGQQMCAAPLSQSVQGEAEMNKLLNLGGSPNTGFSRI